MQKAYWLAHGIWSILAQNERFQIGFSLLRYVRGEMLGHSCLNPLRPTVTYMSHSKHMTFTPSFCITCPKFCDEVIPVILMNSSNHILKFLHEVFTGRISSEFADLAVFASV